MYQGEAGGHRGEEEEGAGGAGCPDAGRAARHRGGLQAPDVSCCDAGDAQRSEDIEQVGGSVCDCACGKEVHLAVGIHAGAGGGRRPLPSCPCGAGARRGGVHQARCVHDCSARATWGVSWHPGQHEEREGGVGEWAHRGSLAGGRGEACLRLDASDEQSGRRPRAFS